MKGEIEVLFPFRYADAYTGVQAMAYRLSHEGPFQLQPEEVVRGEFVSLEEVAKRIGQLPFCPDGVALLKEYQLCGAVVSAARAGGTSAPQNP